MTEAKKRMGAVEKGGNKRKGEKGKRKEGRE